MSVMFGHKLLGVYEIRENIFFYARRLKNLSIKTVNKNTPITSLLTYIQTLKLALFTRASVKKSEMVSIKRGNEICAEKLINVYKIRE